MNSVKLQDTRPTYRNLLCFYTLIKKKKKKIPIIIIVTKKTKHLGKNLTNEAKDLSSGTYKTLIKEKVKTQINARGLEEYC